jgi:site-specific DNA-methyltransferase (adenine-specific)
MTSVPVRMMRVEQIGSARLYLGDCLEILPTLAKVDAVITDPPFNAGKDFANDALSADEWAAFCCRVAGAVSGKCANALIEVGKSDTEMRHAFDAVMRYRWAIALNYTNAMRQGAVGYSNFGLVLWYGEKCYQRFMDRIDCALHSTIDEFSHPSPKEIGHYEQLCAMFTPKDGSVLDPFMGSGTTGVASMRHNRKFIGIEIEPRYFDIACERIENAQRQERLFA